MKVSGRNVNKSNNNINKKLNKSIKRTLNLIKKSNKIIIKDNIKDVIIYCRVSTPEQEMKAQEYACIQYCGVYKYNIKEIVTETGSAYKEGNTPKLDKILKENSNIILLVNRIDRFSRNIVICDKNLKIMKDSNIILKSANDFVDLVTPIGRHTFRNNISLSQLESEMIGERVKSSIKYRIDNGIFIGVPKFGYKMENQTKIQDKYEQAIINFISSNIYKTKTSALFTIDLFKILKISNKPKNFYVSVEFANEHDDENADAYITPSIISDILNEYELLKREKKWNPSKVRNLYNSILNDLTDLTI